MTGYRSKPSYKVITLTRLGQKLVRTKGRLRQIASKSFELYCHGLVFIVEFHTLMLCILKSVTSPLMVNICGCKGELN